MYFSDGSLQDKQIFRTSFSGPGLWGTRTHYAYTPQHPGSERTHYSWDAIQETWIPDRKSEYKVNDSDQVLYYSSFTWDRDKQKWIGIGKIGFNYDAQGRRIRHYRDIWIEFRDSWFTKSSTNFYFGPCEAERILPNAREEVLIYPNPMTDDLLFIESPWAGPTAYQILSLDGKEIDSGTLVDTYSSLNLNQLINGTYLMKMVSGEKEFIQKFQVSR